MVLERQKSLCAPQAQNFAVLKKSNGRGPGRGIEMSPTIAGDREGSLWLGVIH